MLWLINRKFVKVEKHNVHYDFKYSYLLVLLEFAK